MASQGYKKVMAMVYGLGGAVVIVGALFKLMHWPGGGIMLTIGLGTEAFIFVISAFEPLPAEEPKWELVYPQLKDHGDDDYEEDEENYDNRLVSASPVDSSRAITPVSQKIDELFDEAQIDNQLLERLASSIRNLNEVANNISSTVDAVSYTQRYAEELGLAAERVKSLNAVYKVQLENTNNQAAINEEISSVTGRVREQMESLATNLSGLNEVYGGMLSVMKK